MNIKRLFPALLYILSQIIPNDELYLKILYRCKMGKYLDLNNCKTMNEKLQWLKLHNRYDELTDLVDKIKVKDYVAKIIGSEYIVPILKIWDNANDITMKDLNQLPDKFVLKSNHDGGNSGVVICNDKYKFNLNLACKKLNRSKHRDLYKTYREWPYKNVQRRIFAEKYLGANLIDYKFYCFNGQVDSVLLCLDRQSEQGPKFYFFNREWKLCRYNKAGKAAPQDFTLPKPEGMNKMFDIAAMLSKGFPYVRVDLYNVDGHIYFGELTFYPAAGIDSNRLPETDLFFGNKIDLSLARHEVD